MIVIKIEENCPACGKEKSLNANVVIDKNHKSISDTNYDGLACCCAESIWTHPGFEYDGCIRVTCDNCGAQAGLSAGPFELTCTGSDGEPVASWCQKELGEMIHA